MFYITNWTLVAVSLSHWYWLNSYQVLNECILTYYGRWLKVGRLGLFLSLMEVYWTFQSLDWVVQMDEVFFL
jgi:hypothetical protein